MRDTEGLNSNHEYGHALIHLKKSSETLALEGVAMWCKFRPLDPLPDMMAVSNDGDEYRWYFTRVAPFTFIVHIHSTEHACTRT